MRILKLSILALAIALPLAFMSSSPVHADYNADQTQAQATECRNKYDSDKTKQTYADGSKELQQLLSKNCFSNNGNCRTAAGVTERSRKVNCTNKPGTNAAANEADQEESAAAEDAVNNDNTYQGETIQDPALAAKCDKDGCDIIDKYINPLIQLMTVLVGIAVAIGIIWGGIQVSTSTGDPQKSASGKEHIRNAIIALVAYAVLFGFLQFIIPGGIL